MKNTLFLLFLALSINTSAQSLEFNTGVQLNSFYHFDYAYMSTSFTTKAGYDLNVGIDDVYLNRVRLRFTLGLNTYSGGLRASQISDVPYDKYLIDGQINKTVLRLGLYPVNFRIKKRWNINIGTQFSALLHEKVEAVYDERIVSFTPNPNEYPEVELIESSGNLNERHDSYNAKYYVGANIRVAYDIPISESYYLVPQYSFYTTISSEFIEFPYYVKSMQHMLGIGIKKKM